MKHILKFSVYACLLLSLVSCENQDNTFEDYDFSSTYFAYQTPVRTLILGDYDLTDNTKDNNFQFSIGAAVGGMYQNDKDRKVDFVIDETLVNNLYTDKGDTIKALPASYYALSSNSVIIIPKGKKQGYVDVQLTDAFFNDPKSMTNRYVIPLRIVSAQTDSVLRGNPLKTNPDRRIATDWSVNPKDYTLFCVKYINPFHGKYLRRGKSEISNASNVKVDQVLDHKLYVEQSEIWTLTTTKLNQVAITAPIKMTTGSAGAIKMLLNFDANNNCTVAADPSMTFAITGTGKFIKNGDEWGGKKRNSMVLSYSFSAPFVSPAKVIVNNLDAAVLYTGTWATTINETGNNSNDRHNSVLAGNAVSYSFTGSSVAVYCKTAAGNGKMDIYIDDMTTPMAVDVPTDITPGFKVKVYEKSGLSIAKHTIKCVTKEAKPVWFDYFDYTNGLPSGTYTHTINDTLVIRDRAVVLETFVPVVKK